MEGGGCGGLVKFDLALEFLFPRVFDKVPGAQLAEGSNALSAYHVPFLRNLIPPHPQPSALRSSLEDSSSRVSPFPKSAVGDLDSIPSLLSSRGSPQSLVLLGALHQVCRFRGPWEGLRPGFKVLTGPGRKPWAQRETAWEETQTPEGGQSLPSQKCQGLTLSALPRPAKHTHTHHPSAHFGPHLRQIFFKRNPSCCKSRWCCGVGVGGSQGQRERAERCQLVAVDTSLPLLCCAPV